LKYADVELNLGPSIEYNEEYVFVNQLVTGHYSAGQDASWDFKHWTNYQGN
jgi:hypothetical protein